MYLLLNGKPTGEVNGLEDIHIKYCITYVHKCIN